VKERKAKFESTIAYCSANLELPICFTGEVAGEITLEEHKKYLDVGFGFDPIFRPIDSDRTFAEMSIAEKNKHSHRAMAFRKFAEWYKKLPKSKRLERQR
jgi:XTP/dITP diphosphohydrolase